MDRTKKEDAVRGFVLSLGDDELKFVHTRLSQRLGGDLGEAVKFMEYFPDIEKFLGSAGSATEYYTRIDHLEAMVQGESRRRSGR